MSTEASAAARGRGRSIGVGILGVLAVVAILLASVAGTVHAIVLSPDRLTSVVVPVGADPEVQAVVADQAAAKIVTALDVEGRARNLLGDRLGPLVAPSIAQGVESRLAAAIQERMASPAFAANWEQIVRASSTAAINILKGDSAAVTTSDGVIYLNVLPAVAGVLDALKAQGLIDASVQLPDLSNPSTPAGQAIAALGSALGVSLPPDFGQIAVAETSALASAQGAVSVFDALALILIVAAVVLTVAAVVLASDRRAMVIGIAVGSALLLAVVPPLLGVAEPAISGAVASPGMSVVAGALAGALVDAVSWPLRAAAALCLAVALVVDLADEIRRAGSIRARSFVPLLVGAVVFAVAWIAIGPDVALIALALTIALLRLVGRPLLAAVRAPVPV